MAAVAAPAEARRAHTLAKGAHWRVTDLHCGLGPADRAEEEQHGCTSVSLVLAGSFTYEGEQGRALLTPGSLLLGNTGQCFCCHHEHAAGDRCLSFQFEPQFIDEALAQWGTPVRPFRAPRLPPLARTRPLWAQAPALLHPAAAAAPLEIEQFAAELLAIALHEDRGIPLPRVRARDERRVTRVVRQLEQDYASEHTLASLARTAGLARHSFLRMFRAVTGITPWQYLLSLRLAAAAQRLLHSEQSVTDIAADVGFGDLSEFTRRFHAEFGAPPGAWRRSYRQARRSAMPFL